jgi:hypothetical protein
VELPDPRGCRASPPPHRVLQVLEAAQQLAVGVCRLRALLRLHLARDPRESPFPHPQPYLGLASTFRSQPVREPLIATR